MTALDVVQAYGVVAGLGFLLLSVSVLFVRILLDEDRADRFRGKVYHIVFRVSGKRDHEKKFISNDIRGRLNLARRELHLGSDRLARAVDIQWVEGADPTAIDIREGEFIIRLDPAEDQKRNIIYLAEAVAGRTVTQHLRHILSPALKRALDVTMVKKLIHKIDHRPTVETFYEEFYQPLLEIRNPEFKKWNSEVVTIDEKGLYETLLLIELEDFGRRVSGLEPRPYMLGEVEGLVHFLYELATMGRQEKIRLEYLKAVLRVGLILVGQSSKIAESIDPYLAMAKKKIRKDTVDALYVIVWAQPHMRMRDPAKWTKYNRNVSRLLEEIGILDGVSRDFMTEYAYADLEGKRRRGAIVRYRVAH